MHMENTCRYWLFYVSSFSNQSPFCFYVEFFMHMFRIVIAASWHSKSRTKPQPCIHYDDREYEIPSKIFFIFYIALHLCVENLAKLYKIQKRLILP